ncbi:cell division inhibitor SepF [Natranaerovirga hydrolytica]|uniref:Cell division protein SepF n=1 Tax=Natranaerovirga hydrolytica TaxID=680378 RepID=A0A4R1N648_9FIRM|nr:cell division protein SepF [Natranaerovirga hydrolytica]TCK98103.1 cell division inhibitor SepF [Natranaerovirga hydrolytica]
MSKILDKMMDFMKLNDEEEYDLDEVEEEIAIAQEADVKPIKSYSNKRNNSKVVNIHTNIQMEVIVIHPESYDEAQDICDHIKSKRPVVINLENMERDIAQRIMDFISGSCYSLNGNLQRITNNIFIIAPENVDIAGDFKEELKTSGIILPWKSE